MWPTESMSGRSQSLDDAASQTLFKVQIQNPSTCLLKPAVCLGLTAIIILQTQQQQQLNAHNIFPLTNTYIDIGF